VSILLHPPHDGAHHPRVHPAPPMTVPITLVSILPPPATSVPATHLGEVDVLGGGQAEAALGALVAQQGAGQPVGQAQVAAEVGGRAAGGIVQLQGHAPRLRRVQRRVVACQPLGLTEGSVSGDAAVPPSPEVPSPEAHPAPERGEGQRAAVEEVGGQPALVLVAVPERGACGDAAVSPPRPPCHLPGTAVTPPARPGAAPCWQCHRGIAPQTQPSSATVVSPPCAIPAVTPQHRPTAPSPLCHHRVTSLYHPRGDTAALPHSPNPTVPPPCHLPVPSQQ